MPFRGTVKHFRDVEHEQRVTRRTIFTRVRGRQALAGVLQLCGPGDRPVRRAVGNEIFRKVRSLRVTVFCVLAFANHRKDRTSHSRTCIAQLLQRGLGRIPGSARPSYGNHCRVSMASQECRLRHGEDGGRINDDDIVLASQGFEQLGQLADPGQQRSA